MKGRGRGVFEGEEFLNGGALAGKDSGACWLAQNFKFL
jgi:hypothetical protein